LGEGIYGGMSLRFDFLIFFILLHNTLAALIVLFRVLNNSFSSCAAVVDCAAVIHGYIRFSSYALDYFVV